jgi:hypothetical protein|tara:strand:+ start:265 stop:627 length:363 start_codon:yes stop_codon:yes gene_type:complete
VHNDNVLEIDVSKFNLDIRQDLADRFEFGRDICSSNFEFNLIVRIFKFYFVLIYELTKEIASKFEILFQSLRLEISWPKFSSNLGELITNEVQDTFPAELVSHVVEGSIDISVFSSELFC